MSYNSTAIYLQNEAAKLIEEAIRLEKSGNYAKAIEKYKDAIDCLSKLIELDPTYHLNKLYIQRIAQCQAKINELEQIMKGGTAEYAVSDNIYNLILNEVPNVKWEDVIGLEDTKRALIESIIYPSKRPELFPLGWPRNILLYGPPGCGKTLICAAVANEIKAVFFNVDAASLFSKWLGESEKNVARLFNTARKYESENKVVIIFIDEADSVFGISNYEVGGEIRLRNQFLKEMDGLMEKNVNRKIYLIAATNKPWLLDHAFIRRFQLRLYVPPPDFRTRIELFKYYSKPLNPIELDYEKLASMTEGYSASDIKDICIYVQNSLAREVFEQKGLNNKPRQPTNEDFFNAINKRKPSITQEMIKKYEIWYEQFRSY